MENKPVISKTVFWIGNILKWIWVLFLLVDAIMKLIKHPKYVEGTQQLGLPESCVQTLGFYLLMATVLYTLPRTVLLGGLLLTAYLGGAVAITYSKQTGDHPYLFPLVFGVLLWGTEYLRNSELRKIIPYFPVTKKEMIN